MNFLAIIGAFVITLSLLSYGISTIAIQRFKQISWWILLFLTLGVILDFVAITFMVINSDRSAFTKHGILGYSALLTMLINMFLIWRFYLKNGMDSKVSNSVLLYSRLAYGWWLIAYITGSILVIWR